MMLDGGAVDFIFMVQGDEIIYGIVPDLDLFRTVLLSKERSFLLNIWIRCFSVKLLLCSGTSFVHCCSFDDLGLSPVLPSRRSLWVCRR